MNNLFRKLLKSCFNALPQKVQHACFSAFPTVFPAGFASMIEVQSLQKTLKYLKVDCVLDIGANEGQYARQLREEVGYTGLIVSFEPVRKFIPILKKVSEHDRLWTIEEIAVSNYTGKAIFNVVENDQMGSLSAPTDSESNLFTEATRVTKTIEVQSETLASILERLTRDFGFERPFLKMDTQGYDLVIARAVGEQLSKFVGLQTEMSIRKLYNDSASIGEAIDFFQSSGFELSSFVPNNQGHFPLLIEIDGIFVRKDLS